MAVVGHRSRHVADPPAQQVEAPAEVDVLVEHEVPVVEPAKRLEVLGPDEHRRPGGEQHVLAGVVLTGVRPLALPLVAHAVPGEGPVDVVDVVAVPVEDLAGHRRHVGLLLEDLDRGGDPVPGRAGVVVDEGEDLPRRLRRPEVAAAGEADVGGRLDECDPGHRLPDAGRAAVARGVVDDDQLQPVGRPGDVGERLQAGDGVVGAPIVDEDHRHDSGLGLHRSVTPLMTGPSTARCRPGPRSRPTPWGRRARRRSAGTGAGSRTRGSSCSRRSTPTRRRCRAGA